MADAVDAAPDLAALLREAADQGLIYWEPRTSRGAVRKAGMLARIEAALVADAARRILPKEPPKILEAAEAGFCRPGKLPLGTVALTIEWPGGTETSELVSPQAAALLGYDPDAFVVTNEDADVCPVCGEPQRDTPSGAVCANGHGGA